MRKRARSGYVSVGYLTVNGLTPPLWTDCTLLGDESGWVHAFGRRTARFWETNRVGCTLLGDELHAFGRRIARFWETNCTLLGDEFEAKSLKLQGGFPG